jgi:xylulokinase
MITLWWLIEGLLGSSDRNRTMAELENEALRVAPTSEGLVTIPYWNGVMNPYWDDDARGMLLGLHPSHQAAHIYRSILEGIAMETRLHLEGVRQIIGKPNSELIVLGGGSRSNLWCQIYADVLQRPLRRCRTVDAAALGAAVLCAVAHGVYENFERACENMTQLGARFEPGPNSELYDQLYRDVYRGLYLDLESRMKSLSRLRERTTTNRVASFRPPASIFPPRIDDPPLGRKNAGN